MSNTTAIENATLVFRATYMEVRTEEDSFENGCLPETGGIRSLGVVDTETESLEALRSALASEFALDDQRDGWLFMRGEDGRPDRLIFQRNENAHGDPMSEAETARWKEGRLKSWLVDYDFNIEAQYRAPYEITDADIEAAAADQS